MESILKNLTLLKGNDICFECNEPKPTFLSFPTSIFLCANALKLISPFPKVK